MCVYTYTRHNLRTWRHFRNSFFLHSFPRNRRHQENVTMALIHHRDQENVIMPLTPFLSPIYQYLSEWEQDVFGIRTQTTPPQQRFPTYVSTAHTYIHACIHSYIL